MALFSKQIKDLNTWFATKLAGGLSFSNTTDATGPNSAAVVIAGGIAVNKKVLAQTLQVSDFAGTGQRILAADSAGLTSTPFTVTAPTITDTAIQNNLLLETNWNDAGAYTGPAIVNGVQSQWYKNLNFVYYMYDSTTPFRVPISGVYHLRGISGTPSYSVGSAAGTSPSSIIFNGNDMGFSLALTTGSTGLVSNAALITVTFLKVYQTAPRSVQPCAKNAASASVIGYMTTTTTTATFVIVNALSPSTVYSFDFFINE